MPNLIIDLLVDRVDLVDEGANSAAFIKLYKRKEQVPSMTFEEILAKMKPEHAEVIRQEIAKAKDTTPPGTDDNDGDENMDAMKDDLAKAKADLAELQSKYDEVVAKSKPATPDFEDVLKGLDPAVQEVFKSLKAQKDAAEEVAKRAAEQAAEEQAIAKSKELKAIPVADDKLVAIAKSVSPEVFEILKSASKAIEEGALLSEVGKSKDNAAGNTGDSNAAWGKIEKAAEKIAEDQKISKQKAIGEAIRQNPDLYREYLDNGAN